LDDNIPLAHFFYKHLKDLSFEIYCESVYKEKWKYDGDTTIPIENFEGLPDKDQFE